MPAAVACRSLPTNPNPSALPTRDHPHSRSPYRGIINRVHSMTFQLAHLRARRLLLTHPHMHARTRAHSTSFTMPKLADRPTPRSFHLCEDGCMLLPYPLPPHPPGQTQFGGLGLVMMAG